MEAGHASHVNLCYSFPQVKRHFRAILRKLSDIVAQQYCYILLSMALHYAIMRNHTRILHHWADIFIIDIVSIR